MLSRTVDNRVRWLHPVLLKITVSMWNGVSCCRGRFSGGKQGVNHLASASAIFAYNSTARSLVAREDCEASDEYASGDEVDSSKRREAIKC